MSPLRQALVDYLAVRRSLGFKLGRAEGLLLQFVNYAEERGEQHLLTSTMLAWATQPVNTTKNWLSKRLSIVRGFASHLHTIDPATEVPPTDLLPWQRCRATPYLYSDGEVAALITAASSLRRGYRVLTFQTLIGLLAAIRAWVAGWFSWRDMGEVSWEHRHWPRLGLQRIPTSLTLASSDHVATVVGQQIRWTRACERYSLLIARWPTLGENPVLPQHFDVLADYDCVDFERLWSLMLWLEGNPRSKLYLRQVPVEGLDTKWIERRKRLVTGLVCAIRGEVHDADFFAACGLQHPRHRIRVRFLCPNLRKVVGGLEDVESPLEEIAALPLVPKAAIIVENLETGLAFPHLPGVVVLMKLGVAVGVLNNVPWMQGIDALYWGDIDTHGYAILNTARRALPGLRSVLMDKETLFEYRKLWVEEPEQNDGLDLSLLTDCERIVYQGLHSQAWGNNVRLEQERIPWAEALVALEKGLWEHSMKLSIR